MIGDFLGLWDYRYEVFPLTSNYLPWDLFLLPIPVMFFIQVKPKIKPVIKALIYSALASFIGLPLLNWIGVYKPLHWRYIYSFPILIVIYIAASYIASKRKLYTTSCKLYPRGDFCWRLHSSYWKWPFLSFYSWPLEHTIDHRSNENDTSYKQLWFLLFKW